MNSKTKFTLMVTAMVAVTLFVIVSIIAVFAARTQNFTSSITVSYTSREVQGTATAQYFVCSDDSSWEWEDMVDGNGNNEIDFSSTQNLSLNPSKSIEIDDADEYVILRYDFINNAPRNIELTLTYQDTEEEDKNVNLYTMVSPSIDYLDSEPMDYITESIEDAKDGISEKFIGKINTTILANSKMRIYILMIVTDWGLDATFSGSMKFDLDGTKLTDYNETFSYYTNGQSATIIGVAKGEQSEEFEDLKLLNESSLNVPTLYNDLPVTTIGALAFSSQSNLTTISSFGVVENLCYRAFSNSGLSAPLTIPGRIKNLVGCFNCCEDLTSVTLENGLEIIGKGTFNCCSLKSLLIPETVKSIGKYALSCQFNKMNELIIDSQMVCDNLLKWETDIERPFNVGGKIYAKYEIKGLLDWGLFHEHFSISENQDADGYWVYTKVSGS